MEFRLLPPPLIPSSFSPLSFLSLLRQNLKAPLASSEALSLGILSCNNSSVVCSSYSSKHLFCSLLEIFRFGFFKIKSINFKKPRAFTRHPTTSLGSSATCCRQNRLNSAITRLWVDLTCGSVSHTRRHVSSGPESSASVLPRPPPCHPPTLLFYVFLSFVFSCCFRLNRSGWTCYVSSLLCIKLHSFFESWCSFKFIGVFLPLMILSIKVHRGFHRLHPQVTVSFQDFELLEVWLENSKSLLEFAISIF